ncbi:MAG: hypothetical protein ACREP9_19700, partial [Candidatus Dormibacteraceae bacterium]
IGLAAVAQVRGQHRLDGLGVAAGIGAAVALSAYYLLGERAAKVRDPWSLTSLEHIPPTSAGIIGTVEQVVAASVAWLVLDEVASRIAPHRVLPGVFCGK